MNNNTHIETRFFKNKFKWKKMASVAQVPIQFSSNRSKKKKNETDLGVVRSPMSRLRRSLR